MKRLIDGNELENLAMNRVGGRVSIRDIHLAPEIVVEWALPPGTTAYQQGYITCIRDLSESGICIRKKQETAVSTR